MLSATVLAVACEAAGETTWEKPEELPAPQEIYLNFTHTNWDKIRLLCLYSHLLQGCNTTRKN